MKKILIFLLMSSVIVILFSTYTGGVVFEKRLTCLGDIGTEDHNRGCEEAVSNLIGLNQIGAATNNTGENNPLSDCRFDNAEYNKTRYSDNINENVEATNGYEILACGFNTTRQSTDENDFTKIEVYMEGSQDNSDTGRADGWHGFILNTSRVEEGRSINDSYYPIISYVSGTSERKATGTITDTNIIKQMINDTSGFITIIAVNYEMDTIEGGSGSPSIYVSEGFVGEMLSYSFYPNLITTERMFFETNKSYIRIMELFPQEETIISDLKIYSLQNPVLVGESLVFEGRMKLQPLNKILKWHFGNTDYDTMNYATSLLPKNFLFDNMARDMGFTLIDKNGEHLVKVKGNPTTGEFQTYTVPIEGSYNYSYDKRIIDLKNFRIRPRYEYERIERATNFSPFSITTPESVDVGFIEGSGKYELELTGYYIPHAYKTEKGSVETLTWFFDKFLKGWLGFGVNNWTNEVFEKGNTLKIDQMYINVTWTDSADVVNPTVDLLYPVDGEGFAASSSQDFGFRAWDAKQLDTCTLYVNGVEELLITEPDDFFHEGVTVTVPTSDGNYQWFANCTDSSGNEGKTTRNFGVGTPTLSIVFDLPENLSSNLDQNDSMTIEATITCNNARCEDTNATLMHNISGQFIPNDVLNETEPFNILWTNLLGNEFIEHIGDPVGFSGFTGLSYDFDRKLTYLGSSLGIAIQNFTAGLENGDSCDEFCNLLNVSVFTNIADLFVQRDGLTILTSSYFGTNSREIVQLNKSKVDADNCPCEIDSCLTHYATAGIAQLDTESSDIVYSVRVNRNIIHKINLTACFEFDELTTSSGSYLGNITIDGININSMDGRGGYLYGIGNNKIWQIDYSSAQIISTVDLSSQSGTYRGVAITGENYAVAHKGSAGYTFWDIFNNVSCGSMGAGDTCKVSWEVEATGQEGEASWFDVRVLSELGGPAETSDKQINITLPPPPPVVDNPPKIDLFSPQNVSYVDGTIDINFSATDDVGLSFCWYILDNDLNVTLTDCLNTSKVFLVGGHNITLFVNDTIGQSNQSETILFNVQPLPTVLVPQNVTCILDEQPYIEADFAGLENRISLICETTLLGIYDCLIGIIDNGNLVEVFPEPEILKAKNINSTENQSTGLIETFINNQSFFSAYYEPRTNLIRSGGTYEARILCSNGTHDGSYSASINPIYRELDITGSIGTWLIRNSAQLILLSIFLIFIVTFIFARIRKK